ncbi:MAG: hypothetical protein AAF138_00020 [Planctomycetota bacterium]
MAKIRLKKNPKVTAETLGFTKEKKKVEDIFKQLANEKMEEEEALQMIANYSKKEKLGFDKPKDVEKKLKDERLI